MKRRFVAVLAVPALALGFAFASPGTDDAQAYPIGPWEMHAIICTMYDMHYARAVDAGDETTAEQLYAESLAAGC
jgi:hypothetical protein